MYIKRLYTTEGEASFGGIHKQNQTKTEMNICIQMEMFSAHIGTCTYKLKAKKHVIERWLLNKVIIIKVWNEHWNFKNSITYWIILCKHFFISFITYTLTPDFIDLEWEQWDENEERKPHHFIQTTILCSFVFDRRIHIDSFHFLYWYYDTTDTSQHSCLFIVIPLIRYYCACKEMHCCQSTLWFVFRLHYYSYVHIWVHLYVWKSNCIS